MSVTYQRTRAQSRRLARKLNARLSERNRQRIHYQPGSYGTLMGHAWCVWRWIRQGGAWRLTGAAAC